MSKKRDDITIVVLGGKKDYEEHRLPTTTKGICFCCQQLKHGRESCLENIGFLCWECIDTCEPTSYFCKVSKKPYSKTQAQAVQSPLADYRAVKKLKDHFTIVEK